MLDIYSDTFFEAILPPPALKVSEWADKYRWLSSISTSLPGRWKTSNFPFLGEIMDELSVYSEYQEIVFMKGAQVGGTECMLNWLGYIMHYVGGPVLMIQPTRDVAEDYSKQRIDPMIENCQELKNLFAGKSKDKSDTILSKKYDGGIFYLAGSNSAASLRSKPIRFLAMDEVACYDEDVGSEGSAVALAVQRTANFPNRKIFKVSTPLLVNDPIHSAYKRSDQRKYFIPCFYCGEYQTLEWENVKWDNEDREDAKVECIHCRKRMSHYDKVKMLIKGEWRKTNKDGESGVAGFHLNSLYSPILKVKEIAIEHKIAGRDPSLLKPFINTKKGLPWENIGEKIKGNELLGRREFNFNIDKRMIEFFGELLPDGVLVLTAGVDVQHDRLEMEVVGWGVGEESWSVEHHVIPGDPTGNQVWISLDNLLNKKYKHVRDMEDLKISCACIDAGGSNSLRVLDFCSSRFDKYIFAIKGKGRGNEGSDLWPKAPTYNNKVRAPLFVIGTNSGKEIVFDRLNIKEPGPGYCHFPHTRQDSYFKQLVNEQRVVSFSGNARRVKWELVNQKIRTEALDIRVYSLASLYCLKSLGLELESVREEFDSKKMKIAGEISTIQNKQPIVNKVDKKKKAKKSKIRYSSWMYS